MSDDGNPNKETRVSNLVRLRVKGLQAEPGCCGSNQQVPGYLGQVKVGSSWQGAACVAYPFSATLPFPTAKEFWKAENLGACQRFGKWVKLAKLVMVTVPGSAEDVRMFSAMKYLRNPQHNSLKQQHLTCCAGGFKIIEFSVQSSPYPAAIGE
eukprot:1158910-Pelagomonas_calceolata.AAC.9